MLSCEGWRDKKKKRRAARRILNTADRIVKIWNDIQKRPLEGRPSMPSILEYNLAELSSHVRAYRAEGPPEHPIGESPWAPERSLIWVTEPEFAATPAWSRLPPAKCRRVFPRSRHVMSTTRVWEEKTCPTTEISGRAV